MITGGEILARSGEGWKSGPIGLATVLVLCVACYFLFKSMSKHLKKVREEFPADPPATPAAAARSPRLEPPAEPVTPVAPAGPFDADHPSTSA